MKRFNKLLGKTKHADENMLGNNVSPMEGDENIALSLSNRIEKNKLLIEKIFNNTIDLQIVTFDTCLGVLGMIAFIGDIVDKEAIDCEVVQPLMKEAKTNDVKKLLAMTDLKESCVLQEIVAAIVNGSSALFFDHEEIVFIINKSKWETRQVEEPPSESVIKGPKEGFVESIEVNRSLVRRKIKSANLVFERFVIGRETNTEINIGYIKGGVNEEVLVEARERLNKININAILDSGNIEELIDDSLISPIATIGNTQKPDMVAAKILEGRVAIFCDGSPHVLTVPHVFAETLHSPEDYYIRPYIATFLRLIRMAALVVSITLPGLYVALTTYHQDMIPTVLLRTMKGASEGIPLPAAAEAILMTIFFEFLKESGTRLPKAVGSAISIVGALVLGEAGVQAGIVSAPMVLIIAFTAVSSFIVSALNEMITLYRLILLVLSGILGLYGLTVGLFMMTIHASSLRSFGIPYLSPVVPVQVDGLKDFVFRFPLKEMYNSQFFSSDNKYKGSE